WSACRGSVASTSSGPFAYRAISTAASAVLAPMARPMAVTCPDARAREGRSNDRGDTIRLEGVTAPNYRTIGGGADAAARATSVPAVPGNAYESLQHRRRFKMLPPVAMRQVGSC